MKEETKMKVIFLDVDGVLNSQDLFERCGEELVPIDEENIRYLKEIVDATGAQIVLSSSWRYGWAQHSDDVQDWCRSADRYFGSISNENYR